METNLPKGRVVVKQSKILLSVNKMNLKVLNVCVLFQPVDWQLGNWMRTSQTVPQAAGSRPLPHPSIKPEKEEVAIAPSCTDRPKVKTKREPCDGSTRDSKRTLKHGPVIKQEPDDQQAPQYQPNSMQYQNPWSCFTQGFSLPQVLSPGPINSVKIKSEPSDEEVTKVPQKSNHKHPEKTKQKTNHVAKSSQEPSRPPKSLLVRIDLHLLSRTPQAPGKKIPHNTKGPAVVVKQEGGGGHASTSQRLDKASRTSVKRSPKVRNVRGRLIDDERLEPKCVICCFLLGRGQQNHPQQETKAGKQEYLINPCFQTAVGPQTQRSLLLSFTIEKTIETLGMKCFLINLTSEVL